MSGLNSNAIVLLKRILNLTEFSPLVLCIDSIAQTANYLLEEIFHNANQSGEIYVVYVAFENVNCPGYASKFIDAGSVDFTRLSQIINSYLPSPSSPTPPTSKSVIVVDSMNHITKDKVAQFMASIGSKQATVLAICHRDMTEVLDQSLAHYPSTLSLLYFMATTVLEVNPILRGDFDEEYLKEELLKSWVPCGLNNRSFQLTLINRRKSGRSVEYRYKIDTSTHAYEIIKETQQRDSDNGEHPESLQSLTTFNLSTSAKQKMAKDQVALPFLEAQSFNTGGAIVYQFEKDDDYDEEDPYEDPF